MGLFGGLGGIPRSLEFPLWNGLLWKENFCYYIQHIVIQQKMHYYVVTRRNKSFSFTNRKQYIKETRILKNYKNNGHTLTLKKD